MSATHAPDVPVQAITMYKGLKSYSDSISDSIRHIKAYSPETLEEKGITQHGKLNAEGVWAYVNHLAEGLLGKQHFDAQDPRWKAQYAQVKQVITQFGSKGITPDLLEALIGTYMQTATSYVDERTTQLLSSVPVAQGKEAVGKLAKVAGNDIVYSKMIAGIKEPTDAAQIGSQMLGDLRSKINTASAVSTIGDLENLVKGHDAHGAHGGH